MFYQLVRPLLFQLDPEFSHDCTFSFLKLLHSLKLLKPKTFHGSPVSCFGLKFPHIIGLAAGLDKNADCLAAWEAFGFGFIEVGTVTPKPQIGNAKPRLFRLPRDNALINRLGFNNKGVDYLIEQLKGYSAQCPIGVNIGKNRDVSLEQAHLDYLHCFQKVAPFADYVTVNLSSPNTPGLKSLQHGELLTSILMPLKEAQHKIAEQLSKKVPILVKISPDLSQDEIRAIVEQLISLQIDGVIATNTTTKRPSFLTDPHAKEEGGLSGEPLFKDSTEVVKCIYQHVGEQLPIIAVGGIMDPQQAKAKLAAGAKLIQLYTGFIYQGPKLIKAIARELATS